MNNEIKAAVKSIKRVLCDDDFFYQIPDYQRPYSWDKDNISDLIEDLTDAYNNSNENYFCGSLVVVENKKEDRYDVIDGQQRLTTFTILFCVLRDFFVDKLSSKSKDFINLSIQDKYEEGKEKLKFLTSETSQNKFQQTVIKGIKERKNDDNKYLKNAYLLKYFIEERVKEGRINDVNKFAEWVFEKVVLTQIICPNQDTAIQIFNVLNDRGMSLSSVDILKSTLMQSLPSEENRKIFKANWEKVKTKLEAEELSFDNLFNIYLYYLKEANPKTTIHKELLSTFKNEDSLQLIHKLENFADNYIEVRQLENNYFYCLKYLRHSIYWESILTTAKYENYENFDELLKLLVAYYYQNWLVGATIARIKQPSFNILKALKRKATINEIKSILEINSEKYNTTDKYKEVINSRNIYGQKWTKPILLLLEYFSKDDSNQSFIPLDKKIEIEHVLPVSIEEKYSWQNIFTQEERDKYTNTLGNLTLLSKRKNIQARNYAFVDKKGAYENKDNVVTSLILTTDICKSEKWTSEEIDERQEKLIRKLDEVLLLEFDIDLSNSFDSENSTLDLEQEVVNKSNIVIAPELTKKQFSSTREYSRSGQNEYQIKKVHKKVPIWFKKTNQISTKILINYFKIKEENEIVLFEELEKKCVDFEFKNNFDQMKNYGEKNHAKVFELTDNKITLWTPIRLYVEDEYKKYLKTC